MKKCHKADHANIVELRDQYRDVVLERERALAAVAAVREFAWGLGASTASRAQILDALTRQPFAPAGPGTLAPTETIPERCRCDGGAYEVNAHPFLVHSECPIHSPRAVNS